MSWRFSMNHPSLSKLTSHTDTTKGITGISRVCDATEAFAIMYETVRKVSILTTYWAGLARPPTHCCANILPKSIYTKSPSPKVYSQRQPKLKPRGQLNKGNRKSYRAALKEKPWGEPAMSARVVEAFVFHPDEKRIPSQTDWEREVLSLVRSY